MSNLCFGSKVQHNFSKQKGVVIDFRNDPQGYKWKVCFEGHLGDTLGKYTDWFKEETLLEGWQQDTIVTDIADNAQASNVCQCYVCRHQRWLFNGIGKEPRISDYE